MIQPTSSPDASVSRRKFIAFSSLLPVAMATGAFATRAQAANGAAEAAAKHPSASAGKLPVGLELYSVRGEMARDLPATLREVSKMGYGLVEFYAPYLKWTFPQAKETKALMDDLGLRCYSTHNKIESFLPGESMDAAIELNQILGARHLVLASAPKTTTGLEGWKNLCAQLTVAADQLRPHGLHAGFHNHRVEWLPVAEGGPRVMDVIAENTPSDFVLQLDVGTCMEAGADPVAWIKAHPGRIRSIHLKDWTPGNAADGKAFRVLFGEGVSPWREIIAAAESVGGVEYCLLEQEGSRFSEFETAKRSLELWKQFRGGA